MFALSRRMKCYIRFLITGGADNASRRSLKNFGVMIYEVTGRNPLDFNGYGCWCGYGGKGDPVDALDR